MIEKLWKLIIKASDCALLDFWFRNFPTAVICCFMKNKADSLSRVHSRQTDRDWLTDWWTNWPIDKQSDRLPDRLMEWQTNWQTDWHRMTLTDRLLDTHWQIDQQIYRLTNKFNNPINQVWFLKLVETCCLVDWQSDWLTDWHTDWHNDCMTNWLTARPIGWPKLT